MTLRRKDCDGLFLVDLTLDPNGSLNLGWFDSGPRAEQSRGGDVERDVRLDPAATARLCLALLAERFAGDGAALAKVRALCAAHGIPFTETGWN